MQATTGTPLSEASAPAGRRRARSYRPLWVLVALVVLTVDQVTKALAQANLRPGAPRHLLGSWLQLDLTSNAGAAFSLGTSYTVVLSVVAICVIAVSLRVTARLGSAWWAVALGLLLGGALGNLTDRLVRSPGPLRGHVVDFLQLPHWPIFNVADSAITCSAVLLVLLIGRGVRLDGGRELAAADSSRR